MLTTAPRLGKSEWLHNHGELGTDRALNNLVKSGAQEANGCRQAGSAEAVSQGSGLSYRSGSIKAGHRAKMRATPATQAA